MPKPQSRDLELDHLVRQSPLHISRTPSPSPPGSVLDLPNVPFYPRLPPISPSQQLSGLSNPTFNAEDELTSARPSGDPFVILLVTSKSSMMLNYFFFNYSENLKMYFLYPSEYFNSLILKNKEDQVFIGFIKHLIM